MELNFDGRFFFTPAELVNVRIGKTLHSAGGKVEVGAGRGGVDKDRVLVRLVLGERRHRAVPIVAAFFAVFPNLLYGALDLIDLVDALMELIVSWQSSTVHHVLA